MTNSPHATRVPAVTRIRLPSSVAGYFIAGPFFIVLGTFVAGVNINEQYDWVIYPTMIGVAILALGLAMLTTAFVLVGNRQIAQQQTDVLLRALDR